MGERIMYKAIKDNKIIAVSDTDNVFKFMVKDSIEVDEEHTSTDYTMVGSEYVLNDNEKAIKQKNKERVAELKQYLADTDYCILKIEEAIDEAEKQDLREKYADVIKARREARIEINKLEK